MLGPYTFNGSTASIAWNIIGTLDRIKFQWIISNTTLVHVRSLTLNSVLHNVSTQAGINPSIAFYGSNDTDNGLFISGFEFFNITTQDIYL